ncbi:hypothetical protein [Rossellomorea marisflavi]|uniref:hypothetical protein n=1 Tax=Rossellomorea marisflavi TaxID=189381 RepID=UPI003FA065C6
MLVKDLYKIVRNGVKPVIEFNEGVYRWWEEAADPLMMAKVLDVEYDENELRLLLDLKEFESYNRSVARFDWKDENGEAKLSWFDTIFYPKDGKAEFYMPSDLEVSEVFKIKENSDLFGDYLKSKTNSSYVEWLEEQVLNYRKG